MNRAYDDPNHEFYGPVRRCWVVLSAMFYLDRLDTQFGWEWGRSWDAYLVVKLKQGMAGDEALRHIVQMALDAYDYD